MARTAERANAEDPATTPTPARAAAPEEDGLRTSDPAVLRALAHPLRVEMLEILGPGRVELTASEIAARTGQTVANCSFHLRSLEQAGFIERAVPRGRGKPWRAKHRNVDLRPDPADLESVRAAGAGALYVQREAARVAAFLTSPEQFAEPEWNDAVTVNMAQFWATAEEMTQLGEAVRHLTDAFSGRELDPSQRPPGARRGRMLVTVNPTPAPSTQG